MKYVKFKEDYLRLKKGIIYRVDEERFEKIGEVLVHDDPGCKVSYCSHKGQHALEIYEFVTEQDWNLQQNIVKFVNYEIC